MWLILVGLLLEEVGVTFLHLARLGPAIVLGTAVVMVVVVGVAFMRLRRASSLAQAFAAAGVFWLLVLLGLGSMDPVTRTDYPVAVTRYP